MLYDIQVAQLNVAGRAVAAANGFQVIDFELMALTLHTDTYLKDRMHPKGVRSQTASVKNAKRQNLTRPSACAGCRCNVKACLCRSS